MTKGIAADLNAAQIQEIMKHRPDLTLLSASTLSKKFGCGASTIQRLWNNNGRLEPKKEQISPGELHELADARYDGSLSMEEFSDAIHVHLKTIKPIWDAVNVP